MLTIKKAALHHIELLRSLAREIWTTHYPGIITIDQIEYMLDLMYSTETIKKEINSGVIWEIIEKEDEPIGFISVTCTKDGTVKLNKLYIKNTYHGKGFGQRALQHVMNFAKKNNFNRVCLTVNKGNMNAIKAYEKAGFIRTDSVVNDIGGGYVMDDYIYTFTINANR